VGTISVDRTGLKANASKHRGVSYERSGQLIKQMEGEIKELLRKADRPYLPRLPPLTPLNPMNPLPHLLTDCSSQPYKPTLNEIDFKTRN
jgi:hypothetical protein